jgi:hypothetical protein
MATNKKISTIESYDMKERESASARWRMADEWRLTQLSRDHFDRRSNQMTRSPEKFKLER